MITNTHETEEERIIRHADIMAINTDYSGKINKHCLSPFALLWETSQQLPTPLKKIREEIDANFPVIDGNVDSWKNALQSSYDNIKAHYLRYGYIDLPDVVSQEWVLNEVGKKMKQLKGHEKYEKYIESKHRAEMAEINGKIYWKRRAAISGAIGLIVGLGINWLVSAIKLPNQPQPSHEEKPPLNLPKTDVSKATKTKNDSASSLSDMTKSRDTVLPK